MMSNNLKVVDISTSEIVTMLKVWQKGTYKTEMVAIFKHIYGTDPQVTNNMNTYYRLVGADCVHQAGFQNYLKTIDFDADKVHAFGACSTFSVMLSDSYDNPIKSMIPNKPALEGLVHFYKKPSGEWAFIEPSEYLQKERELPDLCFATRFPVYAQNAQQLKSRLDSQLPDLNRLAQTLQFSN